MIVKCLGVATCNVFENDESCKSELIHSASSGMIQYCNWILTSYCWMLYWMCVYQFGPFVKLNSFFPLALIHCWHAIQLAIGNVPVYGSDSGLIAIVVLTHLPCPPGITKSHGPRSQSYLGYTVHRY